VATAGHAGTGTHALPVVRSSNVNFLVFVHDVAVSQRAALDALWAGLKPRVGATFHAACIAGPAQDAPASTRALVASWSSEVEIVAHGLLHRRKPTLDPFSWATGRSDEFAGLSVAEAEARALRSREILEGVFGRSVRGFVPPAFRFAKLTFAGLLRAGYTYSAGLAWLERQEGRVPLGTFAWDTGRLPALALGIEALGHVLAARPKALPCVVLHPADVGRGLAPRAFARIDALLRRGHSPVCLGESPIVVPYPTDGAARTTEVSCAH